MRSNNTGRSSVSKHAWYSLVEQWFMLCDAPLLSCVDQLRPHDASLVCYATQKTVMPVLARRCRSKLWLIDLLIPNTDVPRVVVCIYPVLMVKWPCGPVVDAVSQAMLYRRRSWLMSLAGEFRNYILSTTLRMSFALPGRSPERFNTLIYHNQEQRQQHQVWKLTDNVHFVFV